jgi:putative RNase toxin 10 of polymorphic toxin system
MNAYGFADGDPVNSSDPFGLCGKRGEEPCKQQGMSIEQQKAFIDGFARLSNAVTFGWLLGAISEVGANAGVGSIEARVTNPVPAMLARVIPAGRNAMTLAPEGVAEAFVTDAAAIEGLGYSQLEARLGINPSKSGYEVIRFATNSAGSIASPINRSNPLFVGGGRTIGGAPEFVIPNLSIPADATRTLIRP